MVLVYSTTDGQTLRISEHLARALQARGHQLQLAALTPALTLDWSQCDQIVIGARIRYGKHHPDLYAFIERHARELSQRPGAFFSVNVVARKPGKHTPEGNPYLQQFLKRSSWRPQQLAVFAGRIDYPRYRFWDRQIIRLIMWMTGGPTDPRSVTEFTDWQAVDAFASRISGVS
jgi:menaquinone-dependent protoporphyrinogen oxidase